MGNPKSVAVKRASSFAATSADLDFALVNIRIGISDRPMMQILTGQLMVTPKAIIGT